MTNYNTQDGFAIMRELGALVATPNVNVETVAKANTMITIIGINTFFIITYLFKD